MIACHEINIGTKTTKGMDVLQPEIAAVEKVPANEQRVEFG